MKYCSNCILPDTRPNLRLNADGVCNACENHSTKADIDWQSRELAFQSVVANAKAKSTGYDCLIPVSGGKDSTWQVVKCLEYGLNPLTVTWKTPGRTEIGQQNLDNLVRLGVDHIDYQVNPNVEKRFMVKALERFGSTAIPMHLALFSIPLKIALRFGIPLVVWGENSAFEYGNADEADTGFRLDANWLRTYGVTHGTTAADWISKELSACALTPYFGPTDDELACHQVLAVFLGYYLPWDPQVTAELAQQHGLRVRDAGPRTGLWNYADLDDDFISIHHWLKWYKFGFTRLFDNLSVEIRNGRLSRDEAAAIVQDRGDETPIKDIESWCEFCGLETEQFFAIAERFRNHDIWRREGETWKLPGFLLEDWRWN